MFSDTSLSTVAKRRRQPPLAFIVCFTTRLRLAVGTVPFRRPSHFAHCIAADQFEPLEQKRVYPVPAYSRKERLVGSPLADPGGGPFNSGCFAWFSDGNAT